MSSQTANLFQKVFYCQHNNSERLPPNDATYLTDEMPEDFQMGALYLAFYNSAGSIVTPTGGSVVLELSPIDGQWHGLTRNGTINAMTTGPTATYIVPTFCTLVKWARVRFIGITGADVDHARALIWRGITS